MKRPIDEIARRRVINRICTNKKARLGNPGMTIGLRPTADRTSRTTGAGSAIIQCGYFAKASPWVFIRPPIMTSASTPLPCSSYQSTSPSMIWKALFAAYAAVYDLGAPAPYKALEDAVAGVDVDVLVCNYMFTPTDTGPILDTPLETHSRMIDINARAYTNLIHRFGREMRDRGRGRSSSSHPARASLRLHMAVRTSTPNCCRSSFARA